MQRFFLQPNRAYRDFQLVYGLLALNFLIPATTYLLDPVGTHERLLGLCALVGEDGWPSSESSHLWRFLGISDVYVLGFLCVWLMLDLRLHIAALPGLALLKALTSLQFLWGFAFGSGHRLFLGIGLFDGLTTALFLGFALRAWRALPTANEGLVPRPIGWLKRPTT